MSAQRIALTGAQGFVGSHLKQQLRAMGHTVIPLSRAAPAGEPDWIHFALGEKLPPHALRNVDTLIHCAYDFQNPALNVDGSIQLLTNAEVPNVVFISSLSAFPGCKSQYGQGKLAVERKVSDLGGFNVRLGFVYDETERGISGKLKKLVRSVPVIPLPGSGRQKLYPLSAYDLGACVMSVIERGDRAAVFSLAQPEPVSFADFLRKQAPKKLILLPLPWQPMWLALRALEFVGIPLAFRSDSLLSLVNQNEHPDFSTARALALTFRRY